MKWGDTPRFDTEPPHFNAHIGQVQHGLHVVRAVPQLTGRCHICPEFVPKANDN